MFRKLRNKIVGISMLTTTIVLVVSSYVIYTIVSSDIKHRPIPMPNPDVNASIIVENGRNFNMNEEFKSRIEEDREKSLSSLLTSLIITGLCIEFLILLLSLYLAEQSIAPVKETYEAQKQFIANASHEIKTPLAVIQANLEASEIEGNEWIDNAMRKTEELASLNNQLLALARVDANANESKKTEVILKTLVDDLVKPLKPQFEKKGIKTNVKINTNRSVTLDASAIKQVLNILFDNAIKYSDKKIDITVEDNEITIKNDGTTIEKEKLQHLFERFYQVDKTKNGVGLGLAIANEVASKNGWKIIADSDKKSTSFTLKI